MKWLFLMSVSVVVKKSNVSYFGTWNFWKNKNGNILEYLYVSLNEGLE